MVYRQYLIGRRFWSRAKIRAVITNRRLGLSEVSGWFRKKHRWTEVPVQSVRGIDIGYGSLNWIAIGISIVVLLAGIELVLPIGSVSTASTPGLALLLIGLVILAVYLRRGFIFRIFVNSSTPTMGVGFTKASRAEEYRSQLGGFAYLTGGPGPDVLPFLKEVGGVLEQIRQNPDQEPRIGAEYSPGGADVNRTIDFAAFRRELESNKHPDLAEHEVVYRRYHVGRRYLSRANVWAVFTNRRVGLFEEKGWLLRTYRWNEVPKEGLNGVDVGYGARSWVAVGFFGLWTLLFGYGLAATILSRAPGTAASASRTFNVLSLGVLPDLLLLGLLTMIGLAAVAVFLRRPFIFAVSGPPASNSATVTSSGWMALRSGWALRASPGRDVLPFLLHSGALLQELRQSGEENPTAGVSFQPSADRSVVTSGGTSADQRRLIITQLEENHHPALASGETLYRVYEVGRRFWGRKRVYAVVTNRRAGLLARSGWFSQSYAWTETDIQSIVGVDFSYRYKQLFLVTFRTAETAYQLSVSSGVFPMSIFYLSKPSTDAMPFMQQIGGVVLEIRQSPDEAPRLGAGFASSEPEVAPSLDFLDARAPSDALASRSSFGRSAPIGATAGAPTAYQLPSTLAYNPDGTPTNPGSGAGSSTLSPPTGPQQSPRRPAPPS